MSWNLHTTNFENFQSIPRNEACSGNESHRYNAKIEVNDNEYMPSYELYQGSHNKQQCFQNSLKGSLQNTSISDVFFSVQNIDYIQQQIINEVYSRSNGQYKIGRQNDLQLQIIMRSVYLSEGKNLLCNIEEQVGKLNQSVVKEAIRIIIPQIQQYLGYRKEISKPRCIMSHPVNVSTKGDKIYDLSRINNMF